MPFDLTDASRAWAAARARGVSPKVFADLLSIDPGVGAHVDAARAAGHDDQTIVDNLPGAITGAPDPRRHAIAQLARIGDLPEDQRSFSRFDTRDDYGALGLSPHDIDAMDDGHRQANVGEYARWDGVDNDLLTPVGNPHVPRLRREWEKAEGREWPRDPVTGRRYDLAHIKPLADGGSNTLDNIRPMHPDDHRAEHMANGDPGRFRARAERAKAFDGKVLPYGVSPGKITPPPGRIVPRSTIAPSLGIISVLPDISGILSGRIRTDSFDNFVTDMMGPAGQSVREKFFLNSKPGGLVT
jgi:hypothetical protein